MKKLMFIGFLVIVLAFFPFCKKSLPTSPDISKTLESTTPTINHFTADPDVIAYGGSSTLSWSTSNATKVEISGIGTISLTGSIEVTPDETTTYVLSASNSGNSVSAEVTVTIPVIGNVVMVGDPELNIYNTVAVWTGTVKNIGNGYAYYTKIEAVLYDYNGKKIYPSSYNKPDELTVQVDVFQGTINPPLPDGTPRTATWRIRWGHYYWYINLLDGDAVNLSATEFKITWSDISGW